MTAGWVMRVMTVALVVLAAGCDLAGEQVQRGRVIDQDTGEPIAGAIVVGRYEGHVAWGGSSCNRVESAISDAQGWFELPVDAKDGPPQMEGFKQGFGRGKRTRKAFLSNEWTREWRVVVQAWDDSNTRARIASMEPERYWSQASAKAASGEDVNVYLRHYHGDAEQRLRELRTLPKGCAGSPRVSAGLHPFLEAILSEQVALGEKDAELAETRQWIALAAPAPKASGKRAQ